MLERVWIKGNPLALLVAIQAQFNGNPKAEDEVVRQHLQLNGHGLEQTPGDSGGQRSLVSCNLWGHRESGLT